MNWLTPDCPNCAAQLRRNLAAVGVLALVAGAAAVLLLRARAASSSST